VTEAGKLAEASIDVGEPLFKAGSIRCLRVKTPVQIELPEMWIEDATDLIEKFKVENFRGH